MDEIKRIESLLEHIDKTELAKFLMLHADWGCYPIDSIRLRSDEKNSLTDLTDIWESV